MEDRKYLELKKQSFKMEIDNLDVEHRINIAKYNTKRECMVKEFDSISKQLEEGKQ